MAKSSGGKPGPSRGLGDTIERITRLVGIKPCAECKKRRDRLNAIFPYKPKGKTR